MAQEIFKYNLQYNKPNTKIIHKIYAKLQKKEDVCKIFN